MWVFDTETTECTTYISELTRGILSDSPDSSRTGGIGFTTSTGLWRSIIVCGIPLETVDCES